MKVADKCNRWDTQDMKVFIRERLNGYYGVGSFVVANTLSSAPFILLIALLSTVSVYFLSNLNSAGDRVIYFIIDLFVSLVLVRPPSLRELGKKERYWGCLII